jgi:aminoglycoside phosphotransferase (APT) family kinase protein
MAYPITPSREMLRDAMSPPKVMGIVNDLDYFRTRGIRVKACQVNKVWNRRSGDLELEYILKLVGVACGEKTSVIVGATLYQDPETGRDKLDTLSSNTRADNKLNSDDILSDFIEYIPELSMLLRTPAMDGEFIDLSTALNPDAMKPILSRHMDDGRNGVEDVRDCAIDILRYNRLGNRCTLRYRLAIEDTRSGGTRHATFIAKNYEKKRATRLDSAQHGFQVMSYLRENGFREDGTARAKVPRPIAYIDHLRMVLMEDVPGLSVSECLTSPHLSDYMEQSAWALARLHDCDLTVAPVYRPEKEISALKASAAKTIHFSPQVARQCQDGQAELETMAGHLEPGESALLHGSFHSDHILVGHDGVTILDFDNVCMGDPALDLGRFLANLRWLMIRNSWPEEKIMQCGGTFLQAYCKSLSDERRAAIRFYYRSSLLRIAYYRFRRPKFHDAAAALVNDARRVGEWI